MDKVGLEKAVDQKRSGTLSEVQKPEMCGELPRCNADPAGDAAVSGRRDRGGRTGAVREQPADGGHIDHLPA